VDAAAVGVGPVRPKVLVIQSFEAQGSRNFRLEDPPVHNQSAQQLARVRIRHLDDHYEGHEERVPPARLMVPWDQAEHWIARDGKWATRAASWRSYDDPDLMTAEVVFGTPGRPGVEHAHVGMGHGRGVLVVTDMETEDSKLGP
jgi:hypothetical protein